MMSRRLMGTSGYSMKFLSVKRQANARDFGLTYAFYPVEYINYHSRREERRHSLVEAFYGSQHLNITARSGDEVDDDACASVARSDCWCHAAKVISTDQS